MANHEGRVRGIPVVNPAKAALHTAETLVGRELNHSKRAYLAPSTVAATDGPGDLAALSVQ